MLYLQQQKQQKKNSFVLQVKALDSITQYESMFISKRNENKKADHRKAKTCFFHSRSNYFVVKGISLFIYRHTIIISDCFCRQLHIRMREEKCILLMKKNNVEIKWIMIQFVCWVYKKIKTICLYKKFMCIYAHTDNIWCVLRFRSFRLFFLYFFCIAFNYLRSF